MCTSCSGSRDRPLRVFSNATSLPACFSKFAGAGRFVKVLARCTWLCHVGCLIGLVGRRGRRSIALVVGWLGWLAFRPLLVVGGRCASLTLLWSRPRLTGRSRGRRRRRSSFTLLRWRLRLVGGRRRRRRRKRRKRRRSILTLLGWASGLGRGQIVDGRRASVTLVGYSNRLGLIVGGRWRRNDCCRNGAREERNRENGRDLHGAGLFGAQV